MAASVGQGVSALKQAIIQAATAAPATAPVAEVVV
jgi:hypothetical protein